MENRSARLEAKEIFSSARSSGAGTEKRLGKRRGGQGKRGKNGIQVQVETLNCFVIETAVFRGSRKGHGCDSECIRNFDADISTAFVSEIDSSSGQTLKGTLCIIRVCICSALCISPGSSCTNATPDEKKGIKIMRKESERAKCAPNKNKKRARASRFRLLREMEER